MRDVAFLRAMANQVALAVEDARLSRQLERKQASLIRADRLATLGRLSSGMAHELNNPLGAVLNALSIVVDLGREYASSIDDPQVQPEDHRAIAAELVDNAEKASQWAAKARDFVRGMTTQARDARSSPSQQFGIHAITRQFQVNGPFESVTGLQTTVDFSKRGEWIIQRRAGHRDFLKHFFLRIEVTHFVMKQGIIPAFGNARCSADNDDRRLFRECSGDGIAEAQTTDAIGHADRPHSVNSGITVSRIPGVIFARGTDDANRAVLQHSVKMQHKIAGNAKDIANPVVLQTTNEVFPNRHAPCGKRRARPRDFRRSHPARLGGISRERGSVLRDRRMLSAALSFFKLPRRFMRQTLVHRTLRDSE